jgi:hypothetical protein
VGALGASVLALGGTLLAQNLHSDAPMAQPVQESTQRAEISSRNRHKPFYSKHMQS